MGKKQKRKKKAEKLEIVKLTLKGLGLILKLIELIWKPNP